MNNPVKLALAALVLCPALMGQTVKTPPVTTLPAKTPSATTPQTATEATKPQNSQSQTKDKTPEPDIKYNKNFTSNFFVLEHIRPNDILKTIRGLASEFPGALIEINENANVNTITVRDFPENVESILSAIIVLDKPVEKSKPIEVRVEVIWASKKAAYAGPVPDYLSDIISSVSKTLNYKYFSYGGMFAQVIDVDYYGRLPRFTGKINLPDNSSDIFTFTLSDPGIGKGTGNFSAYVTAMLGTSQPLGIANAYVNIGNGETVVIGAVTVSDIAMIIIFTARSS